MNPRLALLLAAVCAPGWGLAASASTPAQAEPAPTAPTRMSATATAPALAEPSKAATNEPAVQHIVVQGRDTRIDELRVRGQTRRIVVTGAGGTRYEIIPADGLRNLPDAAGTTQGAAGKRVWRVLNF